RGTAPAAFEHRLARIEAQAAIARLGVAVVAAGGEHRTDFRLEELRALRRGRRRLLCGCDQLKGERRRAQNPGAARQHAEIHGTDIMQPVMYKDVAVVALLLFTYLQAAPRPPKPGVKTPGVKIPIEKLKPDAIYAVPGSPDWLAVDPVNKFTWVSNEPKDTVSRLDPASNAVATVTTGK